LLAFEGGARSWTRTNDPLINSYNGVPFTLYDWSATINAHRIAAWRFRRRLNDEPLDACDDSVVHP